MDVRLGKSGLSVGGEIVPLVAGEFEFWRHNPDHWLELMRAVRATGTRLVSSFLCWDFHELAEGEFDLDGRTNPMKDFERFLRLASEVGLLVNVRPGPIIDSEWPTRGPSPDVASLERTDPLFRQRAASWLDAVGQVIARHEVGAGGPIAIVQLDNEVFYPHATEASATEADSAFHIPYHEDLVLADLARWREGGDGSDLPNGTVPLSLLNEAARLASFRFLRDQVLGYLGWVEDTLRQAGVSVPCYTNVKQSCAYLDLGATSRSLSGGAGANNYLDRLETLDEVLVGVWWNGVTRATADFPWAPEYWCGRWVEEAQDTSVFEPDHYKFCLLAQIAFGLRGLNYFSLVERDDWHYSPITAIARIREPLAAPVAAANSVLAELRADRRRADVALVWSVEGHQLELARRGLDWTELSSVWWETAAPKERVSWWETLRSLVEADFDFEIVDAADPTLQSFDYVLSLDDPTQAGELRNALPLAGRHAAEMLLERGATSHVHASAPQVFTSLYDALDGSRSYGFAVNWSRQPVTSELRSRGGIRPRDWLVEPAEWDEDSQTIRLEPRSVAVFLLAPEPG